MTAPRPAATVVLLRDGVTGLQTWLLRRVPQMAFAAGMSVFPGGRVDAGDADEIGWTGRPVEKLAQQFSVDLSTARSALVAAARETYEETGVLLTRPPCSLPAERARVESHQLSFATLLREHGLAVDADAIRPWARWITPVGEPRRYDTFFFVAALPSTAIAVHETSEAVEGEWVDVSTALAQAADGTRPMLPPTVHTLRELAVLGSVGHVMTASAARRIDAVTPLLRRGPDGGLDAVLPDGQSLPLPRSTT